MESRTDFPVRAICKRTDPVPGGQTGETISIGTGFGKGREGNADGSVGEE